MSKKQLILLIILVFLIFAISLSLTITIGKKNQAGNLANDYHPEVLSANVEAAIPPTPNELENLKKLNILLLGYGGAGHEGGNLTDVIQLLQLDFEKKQVALISLPRDLWVQLPNGDEAKINHAYSMGNTTAKAMAEVILGEKIQYFIAIDFVNFKRFIGETLKGIEVEVSETLDDPWYPIKGEELNPCGKTPEEIAELTNSYSGFELERQFECRYKHVYFEKGKNLMHGEEALEYVRSRHGSAGGDFSRSQRQHDLLKAISKKLISLEVINNLPKFFEDNQRLIQTDFNLEAIKYLWPLFKLASEFKLKTLVLNTSNVFETGKSNGGAFILKPKTNFANVAEFVKAQLE